MASGVVTDAACAACTSTMNATTRRKIVEKNRGIGALRRFLRVFSGRVRYAANPEALDSRPVRIRIHRKGALTMNRNILFAATLALCLLTSPAHADAILDWNAKADALAVDNAVTPPLQARTLAILHVSIFEAVNAIERRYAPYKLQLTADRDTSAEAAAASAGYEA